MHAHTHITYTKVNHPESNRLRAPTVIYNKQLGAYWRLRLATMTTDASKNRFRSLRRTLARERALKFPPRLFTPHIVRFDERKCRRADLWPTILPCPRPRRETSLRGDVCIRSTIIALLVRLFRGGEYQPRVIFLTGGPIERERHRDSSKIISPS